MSHNQNIKIRLYPTKSQTNYISSLLGSYRFVYNQALDYKIKQYQNNKSNANLKELGKFFHQDLTKNPQYQWLNDHNTKVLKQAIRHMLTAYVNFFKQNSKFPKFKSKHNRQSVKFPTDAISKRNNYLSNRLTLTKQLKDVKFKCSKKYKQFLEHNKSNIKSATLIKNKSGNYYLTILVDSELRRSFNSPTQSHIGIDLGINNFIITSENQRFDNIKIIRNNQNQIARLQRKLSKKVKYSNNYNKLKIKLAKFYEKLTNIKKNYLHFVVNALLRYKVICIENLGVTKMMQNSYLARSLQELSLHDFKQILKYKSIWYNRNVVEIDRYFPSSKLCNNCGNKNDALTLAERTWKCVKCNIEHDRDVNAAKNILTEGLRLYTHS